MADATSDSQRSVNGLCGGSSRNSRGSCEIQGQQEDSKSVRGKRDPETDGGVVGLVIGLKQPEYYT